MGARPRQPGRLPRRLRSGRGRRAGGVRDRRPALAPGRAAGQPGRLADDHRPQPRDRPPAPRPDARREDTPARRARGRGGRDGGDDLSRRAAGADLHLLPSVARARGAGRAHAARARRSDDGGDRPRVPRSRGDDETAADAGEAQDQGCGHPVQRPGGAPAAAAAGSGAGGCLPRLQRGLRRPRRPRGGGDPAGQGARRADARRAGGARPERADAARRRAPRRPFRGRRARAARRPGPVAMGRRQDRPRARDARPRARAARSRSVRRAGGDRVAAHGGAARLVGDRRVSTSSSSG